MDLPGELMEKPSKPDAWKEPGSPLLSSQQQEGPPPQQEGWGVGSRPGSCQLALKELQDFPKVTGIVSQIRIRPLRGNPRFFSFPYIDESSC